MKKQIKFENLLEKILSNAKEDGTHLNHYIAPLSHLCTTEENSFVVVEL